MMTFKLPKGRVDVVYNKDFKVIIDFAHTPNALLQLLAAVRKQFLKREGRLIHVLGRPVRDLLNGRVGQASGKNSDLVILEEDYRTEDPPICQEIASGLEKKKL
jgi:UDP-N-acetylmuramoyl-L-alanyl-D-glutamate--2,6-diaminopimelate ligase